MMRTTVAIVLALCGSGVFAAAEPPAAPAPKPATTSAPVSLPVKVERDVHYDTIDDHKLYLDIAIPKEGGPYPCVVMFHGGAWITGSRRELSAGSKSTPSTIEILAARGYVAVSVGYRLAPKHLFPAQIQDARAAVRYLRANAKEYTIDPDRFGAAGFSAGGHLALLLGLADKVDGWDAGSNTEQSSKVQCVVDFFGPTDLSLYSKSPAAEDGYLVPVFGKAAKTDPAVYKKASPITYVSKDAPPILMLHGTFDLIVPVIHSEHLHKKLIDAGATAELITITAAGHGFSGSTRTRTTNDAFKFLDKHLKEQK